jgi:hypothetical protein
MHYYITMGGLGEGEGETRSPSRGCDDVSIVISR